MFGPHSTEKFLENEKKIPQEVKTKNGGFAGPIIQKNINKERKFIGAAMWRAAAAGKGL